MMEKDYREIMAAQGICVIIPSYENAGTVAGIVSRALEVCRDVIVVNDGSTDSTDEVLSSLPITLVSYPVNKGKGHALREGFRKAKELGFTKAVTLDADGQHYPEDIPVLVDALQQNPKAMIIGSRSLRNENMPQGNTFANKFSNFWFTVQTGRSLPDTQTGFRLYQLDKLGKLRLLTSRYEAELELLVFQCWKGVPVIPVPIRVYYPPKEERVTHFRPGWDFTRISILNTFLCVLALVYGLPSVLIRKLFRSR